MDTVTISIIAAIVGCVVGVLGWARTSSRDDSELAAAIAAMQASLGYIENDIKDIKAELRAINHEANLAMKEAEAASIAAHAAMESAARAHERLDMLGGDAVKESGSL